MAKSKEELAEEQKAADNAAKNKAAHESAEQKKKEAEEVEKAADKLQKEESVPTTDTVAKIDASSDKAIKDSKASTQKASAMVGDLGTLATQTDWTVDEHGRKNHPNDVKFNVTTPKNTRLQKGIIVVSREVAEDFESKGFGKIVK